MTLTIALRDLTVGTGTDYEVLVDGTNWRTAPDLRSDRIDVAGRHGSRAGRELLSGRRIPVTVHIAAATMAAALAAERTLAAAWGPSDNDLPVVITDDSGVWRMIGRPQLAAPNLEHAGVGLISVECKFYASDPLIYAEAESSGDVEFPAGGTGRTYTRTYPRVYGSAGVSGVVSASNDGDFDAPWQATITGPWVNPTILHVGSGRQLTINVSVQSGETLEIDSKERSILLNGTASRYSSLAQPAAWFDLAPGVNEVRFGGASGSGSAELVWRSAWL